MVRVASKAASKNLLKIKKTYVWISCEMYLPMLDPKQLAPAHLAERVKKGRTTSHQKLALKARPQHRRPKSSKVAKCFCFPVKLLLCSCLALAIAARNTQLSKASPKKLYKASSKK